MINCHQFHCHFTSIAYRMLSLGNHLLSGAKFRESPNQSPRPDKEDISLLVIHNISLPPGEFDNHCIEELFCNELDCTSHTYFESLKDLKVSAHLLIKRAGEIVQFVPFHRKAWHAGESRYDGRENCNEFSIGIELEGTDFEEFTDIQYDLLACVTKLLLSEYSGLTRDRIVGHSDIAPGRKTDPGPFFDWERFRHSLL